MPEGLPIKEEIIEMPEEERFCPFCGLPYLLQKKLIPKGKFSIDFWVEILLNKYKNHLPIEKQISDMAEYGLGVSKGTMLGELKKQKFLVKHYLI